MLQTKLKRIQAQLGRSEIKLSDALILLGRTLHGYLPDERLIWLNRELLGYRKEDLSALYNTRKNVISLTRHLDQRQPESEVPTYRFLSGNWLKRGSDQKILGLLEPGSDTKNVFCNIGVQQIETQLSEMDDPLGSIFSMSFDQATQAEFFCPSQELVRILESVTQNVIEFIDEAITELNLSHDEL